MMDPKKKQYVLITVFTSLFLVLTFVIMVPLFSSIKQDTVDIIFQKSKIFLAEKQIETFNKINEDYLGFKNNAEKISSIFIDQKEPLDFINFIEKTALQLNLDDEIFINNNEIKNSVFSGVSFQISISGSFDSFMKFLEKLESANYLVQITNLSIQKSSSNESVVQTNKTLPQNLIQANIGINVFAQP